MTVRKVLIIDERKHSENHFEIYPLTRKKPLNSHIVGSNGDFSTILDVTPSLPNEESQGAPRSHDQRNGRHELGKKRFKLFKVEKEKRKQHGTTFGRKSTRCTRPITQTVWTIVLTWRKRWRTKQ